MIRSIGFFLAVILLMGSWCTASAQSACDQTLIDAESEFSAGHFYSIPSKLQSCLEGNDFSQDQKVRAYLLLCQAYLILDDKVAAEDNYLRLLKADPEFIPNSVDHPIDIVYLSKKFTATPIFTPHFRIGFNTTFYRPLYSVNTEPYGISSKNSLHLDFQIGAGVDWNINDDFSLCIEGDLATRGFKLTREGISGADVQTVLASQTWIDLPVYLKYNYPLSKEIRLFGYAGFAFNYLLSAKNEFTYTDNKPVGSQLVSTGPSETVTFQQNRFNRSLVFGAGVKYKIGKDFIYADLRYMAGLSNMAVQDKIYYTDPSNVSKNEIGNPDYYLSGNITKYRYLSDVFKIDNLSLSFGYIHPIYDPRRVKKANTKKVQRQIKKEGKEKK